MKAKTRTISAKQYRQWKYANGQHELACADLGCSPDPDAPGPTLHEAAQVVVEKLEDLQARMTTIRSATYSLSIP